MSVGEAFETLTQIVARLRGPGGCPWDREQTHASIKAYVIEEAHEVAEAIERGDPEELKKELGDLLLQVVFHAQMASEAGTFDIIGVLQGICEKLRRRHPHVFGDVRVQNSREVLRNWSRIKAEERQGTEDRSALAGVPRRMPALLRAHRLGEKASHVGFDWRRPEEVFEKIEEEVQELGAAVQGGDRKAIECELGDLLFAAASFARLCGFNAEDALARAADRFAERFRKMEAWFRERGKDIRGASLAEQEAVWQEVKNALG